jgi:Asp/Glu/hydantoin racemase
LRILLINPNTSRATTDQMVAIAGGVAPPGADLIGVTAQCGVPMILTADELAAAAPAVVEMGISAGANVDGIIIGAFGDPGLAALRERIDVPVVGIAEAALLEAAAAGHRFGVATTTPALVDLIAERVREFGVADLYTGIRLTQGDPLVLVTDPPGLVEALAEAVRQSIRRDGAEAVVIGGGPLGQAAIALASRFTTPIIAPIPASVRRLLRAIA